MIDDLTDQLNTIIATTHQNATFLLCLVAIVWGAFFLTRLLPGLLYLGVLPRKISGLMGMVCSPFLHANFNHLFYNTIPLVVLSDLLLIQGQYYFIIASIIITLLAGLGVWLIGKPGLHIGASGVITGYWALLVTNVYQEGTLMAIILGATAIYGFAGIFLGIFPQKKGVSWEAHLSGLVAGGICSLIIWPIMAILSA